ncbi:hypothetical protein [Pleionea sp. CnH1-48]|uniref:hypothetical protein n=1 Tax=Pleionea sp. CnH1-48 TaxID=2954494 RepID=UPI002097117F|nr:hypothetical protein [Pleionea sp. CnH1-48]MCO7224230.1 hypothetical protein [Pleionea sp. CnH1-48]
MTQEFLIVLPTAQEESLFKLLDTNHDERLEPDEVRSAFSCYESAEQGIHLSTIAQQTHVNLEQQIDIRQFVILYREIRRLRSVHVKPMLTTLDSLEVIRSRGNGQKTR